MHPSHTALWASERVTDQTGPQEEPRKLSHTGQRTQREEKAS